MRFGCRASTGCRSRALANTLWRDRLFIFTAERPQLQMLNRALIKVYIVLIIREKKWPNRQGVRQFECDPFHEQDDPVAWVDLSQVLELFI